MTRVLLVLSILAALTACRTPGAAPVDCDRHLVPINGSPGPAGAPLAHGDSGAVAGGTRG